MHKARAVGFAQDCLSCNKQTDYQFTIHLTFSRVFTYSDLHNNGGVKVSLQQGTRKWRALAEEAHELESQLLNAC